MSIEQTVTTRMVQHLAFHAPAGSLSCTDKPDCSEAHFIYIKDIFLNTYCAQRIEHICNNMTKSYIN